MFVDAVKIYVQAGNGGRGCVAFLREAFRPRGGPCGGNGGKGGDIKLQADPNVNNLTDLFHHPHLRAANGAPGEGKGKDGRNATDLIVKVPCGTLIWQLPDRIETTNRPEESPQKTAPVEPDIASGQIQELPPPEPELQGTRLYGDLVREEQRLLIGRGGRGGLGNRNFATARRQNPRFAQPGETGTQNTFFLELRVIADIGLLGFPNAGKSTLLATLSRARPKIADYPFTTLRPQVGIVEYPDYQRTTVCDIPGLIAGAHQNAGLGSAFLRHLKRCKALAWLIDMAGSDGRRPWEDYRQLKHELGAYDKTLLKRPSVVLANKMDLSAASENLERFREKVRHIRLLPIASGKNQGLDDVKKAFLRLARRVS